MPILAGYGGLHSHRLVRRRRAIGSFFSTAQTNGHAVSLLDYKKASVEEKKKLFSDTSIFNSTNSNAFIFVKYSSLYNVFYRLSMHTIFNLNWFNKYFKEKLNI